MNERRPLRERENIMACDVCDAISELVGRELAAPKALDKASIAEQLILLAHRQEDGTTAEVVPIVRRMMLSQFLQQLSESSVFRAGYKQFATEAEFPVVPVTMFFFERIYTEDVRDCLDAMDGHEIRQSLPKRETRMRDPGSRAIIRDEDDEVIMSGSVAGIIIFPQGADSPLLTYWLHRRSRSAIGAIHSTVTAIEHARPDEEAVARLGEYARGFKPTIRKALPRLIKADSGEDRT